jgi:hypothetical protein
MRPKDTDEQLRVYGGSLEARGSSIADADAETWNALADEWRRSDETT